MNRKLKIFVIVLILLFLVSFLSLYLIDPKCKGEKNGWSCDFRILKWKKTIYEQKCKKQGGLWIPSYSSPDYFCDLPFKDAGKACTSSKQCEYLCLAENATKICPNSFPDNLYIEFKCKGVKGKCARIEHFNIENDRYSWFEINNDVMKYISSPPRTIN